MTWIPPTDDPALVNAQAYAAKLMPFVKDVEHDYDPGVPDIRNQYSYGPFIMFAAAWKITGDTAYVERAVRAMKATRAGLAKIRPDPNPSKFREALSFYWFGSTISLMLTAIGAFEGRPEHAQLLNELGDMLAENYEQLPVYWETGGGNRPWSAAFLYDVALRYGRPTSRAAEFQQYADETWDFWFSLRDSEEDSERYSLVDLAILFHWVPLRGFELSLESKLVDLWGHYAELITNDGTYVSYGESGVNGDYMFAVWVAETAAALSSSGQYKWLAHRAFWNGRDRMLTIEQEVQAETQRMHLALAYLVADETIFETPVAPSTTVTYRQFREWSNWADNIGCGPGKPCKPVMYLHPETQPSKIVFRSGPTERDDTFILQAGNQAGHGHPDSAAIIHYSGGFSTYLCNGVSRLDDEMEQHNLVVLQDPNRTTPWNLHNITSEQTAVSVAAQVENHSYAHLSVGPYPGLTADQIAARWPTMLGDPGSTPGFNGYQHAIGYKNWPVTLDREALLIGGVGAVIRDTVTFQLAVHARVGQNWVIGDIVAQDSAGSWVLHHVPPMSNFETEPSPHPPAIDIGPKNLWIWMHTSNEIPIQTLALDPPPPTGNPDVRYHQNLTHHAWQPVISDWAAGSQHTMTSVLIPVDPAAHTPDALPAITLEQPQGVIAIRTQPGLYYHVYFGNPSGDFTFGDATFSGKAAFVKAFTDHPTILYGWQLTHVAVAGNTLWAGPESTNGTWNLS